MEGPPPGRGGQGQQRLEGRAGGWCVEDWQRYAVDRADVCRVLGLAGRTARLDPAEGCFRQRHAEGKERFSVQGGWAEERCARRSPIGVGVRISGVRGLFELPERRLGALRVCREFRQEQGFFRWGEER